MKSTLSILATLLTLAAMPLAGNAQTFTVTSNNEPWATLVSGTTCNNCTIIIPAAFTLSLNSAGTCTSCTFSGGAINITSGFTFAGTRSVITGSSISVNAPISFQAASLINDSIQDNDAITFNNSTDSFTNSHIDIANGASISLQRAVTTNSVFALTGNASLTSSNTFIAHGSSFFLDGTSNFKISSSTQFDGGSAIALSGSSTFVCSNALALVNASLTTYGTSSFTVSSTFTASNSAMTLGDNSSFVPKGSSSFTGGSLTMDSAAAYKASSTVSFTGADVTLNGTSKLTASSSVDIESTTLNLNGNASISAKSTVTIGTGSDVTIGDGSGLGSANITTTSNLVVSGGSLLGIASGGNFLKANSTSGTGGFNIGSNTLSCNSGGTTGFPNACAANTVFGCATLNASGGVACTVLAVADLSLTAVLQGSSTVALSWTDPNDATVTGFQVQRSAGNNPWTTLATIPAGSVTGTYHFEDDAAPAGTIDYRLVHIDRDGKESYSAISSVNVPGANTGALRLYPNPATGHTVNLATPSTGKWAINVFTLTGQLLLRTVLQGQTQYVLRLPSQLPAGTMLVVQATGSSAAQTFTLLLQ